MDFRAPTEIAEQNAEAFAYLTDKLGDSEAGRLAVEKLIDQLGNAVARYPDWHPILTAPAPHKGAYSHLSELAAYRGLDHTTEFVRGFVTCPYSDKTADELVEAVNQIDGLHAYRLGEPLYSDSAFPVVVVSPNVVLEADGTIRSRDALAWFVQHMAASAENAQVGETWWNIRSHILGAPGGARSSLFVNQHTGVHMRKILEAMNNSGMFGPILESSLEMLSPKKREAISEMLIRTAVKNWDGESETFEFEMRGETCKASIRDTWKDNMELSVRIRIGKHDLNVSGFYYPKDSKVTFSDPFGKREVAEKFL